MAKDISFIFIVDKDDIRYHFQMVYSGNIAVTEMHCDQIYGGGAITGKSRNDDPYMALRNSVISCLSIAGIEDCDFAIIVLADNWNIHVRQEEASKRFEENWNG